MQLISILFTAILHIVLKLCAQLGNRGELTLLTNLLNKADGEHLAIQIAVEVEDVGLKPTACAYNRGADTDV